jgi:hypothetical protein
MLNPSTADAYSNDPTLHRVMRFSYAWGCGGLTVVNLFAYRATDPTELRRAADPVGPENDAHLLAAMNESRDTVYAWGAHGGLHGRDKAVRAVLDDAYGRRPAVAPLASALGLSALDARPWCLGTTKAGHPRHPLYLPASTLLTRRIPPLGGALD